MTLYINTTNFESVHFALINKDSVIEFFKQLKFNENYQTLELLEAFLKKQKTTIKQIKQIVVCSGPGSFTGIRVGVSMAMAMGFALDIPVITIPKSKVPQDLSKLQSSQGKQGSLNKLRINYGQKPKITKSKKKFTKQKTH